VDPYTCRKWPPEAAYRGQRERREGQGVQDLGHQDDRAGSRAEDALGDRVEGWEIQALVDLDLVHQVARRPQVDEGRGEGLVEGQREHHDRVHQQPELAAQGVEAQGHDRQRHAPGNEAGGRPNAATG
jgi:hypothetical protein